MVILFRGRSYETLATKSRGNSSVADVGRRFISWVVRRRARAQDTGAGSRAGRDGTNLVAHRAPVGSWSLGMSSVTAFRPPAVPLVVCDPYFSVWSFGDRLTDDATRHWTGR